MASSSKCETQYLRSTMNKGRLNHTMVLHVCKEMLDDLELNVVAKEFVQGSEHQLAKCI